MGRGALTLHALQWVLRIFFIVIFFFAISAIINQYINAQVNAFNAEAAMFFHRVLTAPALVVTEEAFGGVPRVGIFDTAKCKNPSETAARFEAQYSFGRDQRHLAAAITLQDGGNTLCDMKYNPRLYSLLAPQQAAGGAFARGVNARTFRQPALFMQDGKLKRGTIIVNVVQEK